MLMAVFIPGGCLLQHGNVRWHIWRKMLQLKVFLIGNNISQYSFSIITGKYNMVPSHLFSAKHKRTPTSFSSELHILSSFTLTSLSAAAVPSSLSPSVSSAESALSPARATPTGRRRRVSRGTVGCFWTACTSTEEPWVPGLSAACLGAL